MDPCKLDEINTALKDIYGHDFTDRQHFRLVWAPAQFEHRYGNFADFYGHIFIREQECVREAHKYPYLKPCYVLEKLTYSPQREIIGSDQGHYELLWAFTTKSGEGVEPTWNAIQFYLRLILWGPKRTKAFYEDFQSQKDREEVAYMSSLIDETISIRTAWQRKNSSVFVSKYNDKQKSVYTAPGTSIHIHR